MIQFIAFRKGVTEEHLGFLPLFFSVDDPRTAREQIDANYQHGGGWRPFKGFTMAEDFMSLHYSGDPPMRALAGAILRTEKIVFYEGQWLAIIQPDGSHEIARVD